MTNRQIRSRTSRPLTHPARTVTHLAPPPVSPETQGTVSGCHDLREIAAVQGAEAIAARISTLRAAGNHQAADCIEREWQGPSAAADREAAYIRRARMLATDLYDDPLDDAVAAELMSALADHFPTAAAFLRELSSPARCS